MPMLRYTMPESSQYRNPRTQSVLACKTRKTRVEKSLANIYPAKQYTVAISVRHKHMSIRHQSQFPNPSPSPINISSSFSATALITPTSPPTSPFPQHTTRPKRHTRPSRPQQRSKHHHHSAANKSLHHKRPVRASRVQQQARKSSSPRCLENARGMRRRRDGGCPLAKGSARRGHCRRGGI